MQCPVHDSSLVVIPADPATAETEAPWRLPQNNMSVSFETKHMLHTMECTVHFHIRVAGRT